MENSATILIIDDNPVNGRLLQTVLKRSGYRTLQAESGPDGRKLAQAHSPDLIFLDVLMPDENGFETCGALKLDPKTKEIPVIFLSSLHEPEEKVRGFDLGAVDYITKPYNQEELLARTRLHIRLKQNYAARTAGPEKVAKQLRDFREAASRRLSPKRVAAAVTHNNFPTTKAEKKHLPSAPHKKIMVGPGEYYVSKESLTIRTVLGSCVAACLWDQKNRVVGMNHFLLTDRARREDLSFSHTEAGKYGVYAMELLINAMIQQGARRENLQAKVFGGGSMMMNADQADSFFAVGEENSRFIIEFLKTEGIPLLSADLRGNFARVIYFSSEDYSVYVRRIGKSGLQKVAEEERVFWKTSLERQQKIYKEPDLWI